MRSLVFLSVLAGAPALAQQPAASPPEAPVSDLPALAPFAAMEAAVKARDIPAFQAQWTPEGWGKNLAGEGGLSGQQVAGQAKSDGWVLRPDPSQSAAHREDADVWLVRCDVFSLKADKVVDAVYTVVVKRDGKWLVAGASEALPSATALAEALVGGAPLGE